MAGSPESPTNQPMPQGAIDRIGHFYSKLLLSNKDTMYYWDPVWGPVGQLHRLFFQERKLSDVSKAEIRPILESIDPNNNLHWQLLDTNKISTIFAGFPKDHLYNESKTTVLSQALATIEFLQKANAGEEDRYGQVYSPICLRIAGIDKEQGRIIAATYNLEDQNRLTKLNVSAGRREMRDFYNHYSNNGLSEPDEVYYQLKCETPSTINEIADNLHDTAGIITPAMFEKVSRNSPFDHDYLFKFSRRVSGISLGHDVKDKEFLELSEFTARLGYYLKSEKGIITVGLNREVAEKRETSPWEIIVPEALPKV